MTKIRMFMFAALAAIVALGVCGQQALALDTHFKIASIGRAPVQSETLPPAASQVHEGVTGMGVAPPLDAGGLDTWPCFTGTTDADCSSIASGGLVIGVPVYTWSLTNCTSSTAACGQIFWTFETDVVSTKTPIDVSITVTQGTTTKTTIFSTGTQSVGANNPGAGYIEVISDDVAFGPGDCAAPTTCGTPVAGPATITVTTIIGKQKATGTATITLQ
jgi:hypothetical protein